MTTKPKIKQTKVILMNNIGKKLIETNIPNELLRQYVSGLCSQFYDERWAVYIEYKNKLYRFDRLREPIEYRDMCNSQFILDWDLIKKIEGKIK